MRKTVVIPTYWSRKNGEDWREGDIVYDHPTGVDEEGTLGNTLESMKILNQRDFKLVILVCPTAPDVEAEAEKQVRRIVAKVDLNAETYIFTFGDLRKMAERYREGGATEGMLSMLTLNGYANVRNICLLAGVILTSEAVILIDDDEIFEMSDFMEQAVEFLGKRIYGDVVHGVAGYYLNKHDQYYDDVVAEPWMTHWDRFGCKARAFDKIIGCSPRIKRTPFAFGGAMVLHQDLFECVPFDPLITRGEDIDYLINAKMYGFSFFLDNTLSIKHLPVPKKHPQWKRLREDIYRFVYERAKITSQYDTGSMVMVTAEDFDPYPGEFLREDLDEKIYKSNMMLSMHYISEGDAEGSQEALRNIYISRNEATPSYDVFTRYRKVQKNWEAVVRFAHDNRYELRKIMEGHNLSGMDIVRDSKFRRSMTPLEIERVIRKSPLAEGLTKEDMNALRDISTVNTYYENEKVFSAGDYIRSVSIILKGRIALYANQEDRGKGVVAYLSAGDLLGESGVFYETYSLDGVALEFTELLSFHRKELRDLIGSNTSLGVKLLSLLLRGSSTKLRSANERLKEERSGKSVAESDFGLAIPD